MMSLLTELKFFRFGFYKDSAPMALKQNLVARFFAGVGENCNREIREIREHGREPNSFAYFAWFAVCRFNFRFCFKKSVCIRVHPAFAACFGVASRG